MKKLLTILLCLTAMTSYGQSLTNPATIGQVGRNQQVSKGLNVPDTLLTSGKVIHKGLPATTGEDTILVITPTGQVRKQGAVGWGVNIYNSNGTLVGDRIVNTDTFRLQIGTSRGNITMMKDGSMAILSRNEVYVKTSAAIILSDSSGSILHWGYSVENSAMFLPDYPPTRNDYVTEHPANFLYTGSDQLMHSAPLDSLRLSHYSIPATRVPFGMGTGIASDAGLTFTNPGAVLPTLNVADSSTGLGVISTNVWQMKATDGAINSFRVAPGSAGVNYTLPTSTPTDGSFLHTNAAGELYWGTGVTALDTIPTLVVSQRTGSGISLNDDDGGFINYFYNNMLTGTITPFSLDAYYPATTGYQSKFSQKAPRSPLVEWSPPDSLSGTLAGAVQGVTPDEHTGNITIYQTQTIAPQDGDGLSSSLVIPNIFGYLPTWVDINPDSGSGLTTIGRPVRFEVDMSNITFYYATVLPLGTGNITGKIIAYK